MFGFLKFDFCRNKALVGIVMVTPCSIFVEDNIKTVMYVSCHVMYL